VLGANESEQGLITLNRNATLGQVVRQRFPPQPQPFDAESPLHAMLMDAGMFVTEEIAASAIEMLFSGGMGAKGGIDNAYAGAGNDDMRAGPDPGLAGGMFGGLIGAVGDLFDEGGEAAGFDINNDY